MNANDGHACEARGKEEAGGEGAGGKGRGCGCPGRKRSWLVLVVGGAVVLAAAWLIG